MGIVRPAPGEARRVAGEEGGEVAGVIAGARASPWDSHPEPWRWGRWGGMLLARALGRGWL